MTSVITSSDDLTLDLFRRVAWEGESVALSPAAELAIDRRRAEFLRFLESNEQRRFYGITTKHHYGAQSILDAETRAEYASRLPSTPASFGPVLPPRVVRGIMLARVTDALNGTAPLRASTTARILRRLDGPLPDVPARGAGEPGDIIPLGHLFRALFDGSLELGEGMALINGSPVASAVLADAALDGQARVERVEAALALAALAIGAPSEHFAEPVARHWADPYAEQAMRSLRELTADADPSTQRSYQAPVSFRSGPRLTAWLRRAQAQAEECAGISLRSSSNNPAFLGPEEAPPLGEIMSNGGYHNPWATPCLDALGRSWADLALLLSAQVSRLVEDPAGLVLTESESFLTGFYMSAAGWSEEARSSATSTLLGVAGGGQTDTGTPDLLAWRKAMDVGRALDANCAILAVVAAQTLQSKGWRTSPALEEFCSEVLKVFPVGTPPVDFGNGLEAVAALMREPLRVGAVREASVQGARG